jgi:hypothetical protein
MYGQEGVEKIGQLDAIGFADKAKPIAIGVKGSAGLFTGDDFVS